MRRRLLALVGMLLACGWAAAEKRPVRPDDSVAAVIQPRPKQDRDLDGEQRAADRDLNIKEKAALDAVEGAEGLAANKKQTKLADVRKRYAAKRKALNDKFKALREERRRELLEEKEREEETEKRGDRDKDEDREKAERRKPNGP